MGKTKWTPGEGGAAPRARKPKEVAPSLNSRRTPEVGARKAEIFAEDPMGYRRTTSHKQIPPTFDVTPSGGDTRVLSQLSDGLVQRLPDFSGKIAIPTDINADRKIIGDWRESTSPDAQHAVAQIFKTISIRRKPMESKNSDSPNAGAMRGGDVPPNRGWVRNRRAIRPIVSGFHGDTIDMSCRACKDACDVGQVNSTR